jgi:hypothetical protein
MVMTIYSSTFGFKSRSERPRQKSAGGVDHLSPAWMGTASNLIGEALGFQVCRDECSALALGARTVEIDFQQGQDIQCG